MLEHVLKMLNRITGPYQVVNGPWHWIAGPLQQWAHCYEPLFWRVILVEIPFHELGAACCTAWCVCLFSLWLMAFILCLLYWNRSIACRVTLWSASTTMRHASHCNVSVRRPCLFECNEGVVHRFEYHGNIDHSYGLEENIEWSPPYVIDRKLRCYQLSMLFFAFCNQISHLELWYSAEL